jgi:DNA modification methylase
LSSNIAEPLRKLAIAIEELHPDPANARKHNQKNLDAIKASLHAYGQRKPIVVQRQGMIVRAGNGTLDAAKALGWTHLAAVVIDEDNATASQFAIADNRTGELAEWDTETLATLLDGMDDETRDLLAFDEKDMRQLMSGLEPADIVEDEAPPVPDEPVTKLGDLWILGEHRLLCGDSAESGDVARLMDGVKAHMMFTDPPYGVDYSGGVQFDGKGGAATNNRERLANDSNADIYAKFLPVCLPFVDGPCYLWFAGSKALPVYQAVHDCGGVVSALLIWHKTNATYAAMNAQYKQRHEPLLYFKPKGSTLRWVGPTDACTLWEFKRDGVNDYHPTQKPVALSANAMKNHKAHTVVDFFAGSGSTLIAAEQLGRKCYGMEISPAYCDVIVKRWENLTGKQATRG